MAWLCAKRCSSFFDSCSMMRASLEKLRCFWLDACRAYELEPVATLPRELTPESSPPRRDRAWWFCLNTYGMFFDATGRTEDAFVIIDGC